MSNLTVLLQWYILYKNAVNNTTVSVAELPHGGFNPFVIRPYGTYTADSAFLNTLTFRHEQAFVLSSFAFFFFSSNEVSSLVFSNSEFTSESTNPLYVF
jgi:hypothetical protein